MAIFFQYAQTPLPTDIPVHNYGSTDIPANRALALDATNYVGASATVTGIGVMLPITADRLCVGVSITTIPAGGSGIMRPAGPIAECKADGAVTVDTCVCSSGDSGDEGFVKTAASGKPQLGIALTTAADEDPVLVMICSARNA